MPWRAGRAPEDKRARRRSGGCAREAAPDPPRPAERERRRARTGAVVPPPRRRDGSSRAARVPAGSPAGPSIGRSVTRTASPSASRSRIRRSAPSPRASAPRSVMRYRTAPAAGSRAGSALFKTSPVDAKNRSATRAAVARSSGGAHGLEIERREDLARGLAVLLRRRPHHDARQGALRERDADPNAGFQRLERRPERDRRTRAGSAAAAPRGPLAAGRGRNSANRWEGSYVLERSGVSASGSSSRTNT